MYSTKNNNIITIISLLRWRRRRCSLLSSITSGKFCINDFLSPICSQARKTTTVKSNNMSTETGNVKREWPPNIRKRKPSPYAGRNNNDDDPDKRIKRQSNEDGKPARSLRRDERRDLLTRAKLMWETLRPRATGKAKSEKLASELQAMVSGRLSELAFKHDGSRIIQWLLTSGNPKVRQSILAELQKEGDGEDEGLFSKLVSDRYAKHLALKVMKGANSETRQKIFDQHIQPHVPRLVRQVHSANVLDTAYCTLLNGSGKIRLVQSILFSREPMHWNAYISAQKSAVDSDGNKGNNNKTLSMFEDVLESVSDEFKNVVNDSAYEVVSSLIEKEVLLPLEVVHATVREWMEVAVRSGDIERLRGIACSIAPQLVHFAHTKPGLWVSVTCIKMLDAKHRKKVVRSIRGHVRKLAMDEFGSRVIIALQEWMDDTRLLGKVVSTELCTTERVLPEMPQEDGGDGDGGDRQKGNKGGGGEGGEGESFGPVTKRGGLSRAEKKAKEKKKKKEGEQTGEEKETDVKEKEEAEVKQDDPITKNSNNDNGEVEENLAKEEDGIDLEWMEKMCNDPHGRSVLLHVLFGHDTRYFNPDKYGIVWEGMDTEKFGQTSKKDGEVRRKELCAWVSKGMCKLVERRSFKLIQSLNAGAVIVGAAAQEDMKQAVVNGLVTAMKTARGVEMICRSGVGKRILAATFKVGGSDFTADVVRALSDCDIDVVKRVSSVGGCENLVKVLESS